MHLLRGVGGGGKVIQQIFQTGNRADLHAQFVGWAEKPNTLQNSTNPPENLNDAPLVLGFLRQPNLRNKHDERCGALFCWWLNCTDCK